MSEWDAACSRIDKLESQRDRLLAALKEAREAAWSLWASRRSDEKANEECAEWDALIREIEREA